MSYDDDGDVKGISEKEFDELLGPNQNISNNVYSI